MLIIQLVDQKKKILSTKNLKANPQNLQRAYKALSNLEHVRKAKVFFSETINKGLYNIKFKRILFFRFRVKNRILIEPDQYWLIYLFHEFIHVLMFNDFGYTGHGKHFDKLYGVLLEKYFDTILTALLKLQSEDELKSSENGK